MTEIVFILATLALVAVARWATGRESLWWVNVDAGWVVIGGVPNRIIPQNIEAPEGVSMLVADKRGNVTFKKARR